MYVLSLSWWFAGWRSLVWLSLEVREKNVGSSSFLSSVPPPGSWGPGRRRMGRGSLWSFPLARGKEMNASSKELARTFHILAPSLPTSLASTELQFPLEKGKKIWKRANLTGWWTDGCVFRNIPRHLFTNSSLVCLVRSTPGAKFVLLDI